jgi:hypothetical protein
MSRKLWILVTAAAIGGLGAWWFLWRDGGSGLLAQAPYRVLREHEPEAWQRVLAAYQRFQADPAARADFVNVANEEFSAAATRRLSSASHQSKLALMRDFVANLKLLHSRMGDACFRYLYPEVAGGADVSRQIDAAAQARTLELAAEVIRSSAEEPVKAAPPQEIAPKLAPIIEAVYAQFGTDTQMLAHAHEPGVDRLKVCAIAISLYERILALPAEDAALVFTAVAAPGG